MNKRISYVTLVSDIYILLVFSNVVYAMFFGLERIGNASFTIADIGRNTAIILAIAEIVFSLIMAYLLHKCNYIAVRVILIIVCVLNIIYRIINLLHEVNAFTLLMIFISIVLFIILILYKRN